MNKFVRLGIIGVLVLGITGGIVATAIINNRPDERPNESIDETLTNVTGDLQIRIWEGGYGVEWLENVAAGFQRKFPNVTLDISPSAERNVVLGEITSENPPYDLFFSESVLFDNIRLLEPLNDVYDYKWANEEKSIAQKIEPAFVNAYDVAGTKYMVNAYSGAWGIVYNCDWIEDDEVPVTTEELKALCVTLKTNSITPFVFSGEAIAPYWSYAYYNWVAQYEGTEMFELEQLGKIKDASGNAVYDPSAAYPIGQLKALQVCEDLLWQPNGFIAAQSTGYQFITAQKKFLDGEVAMMYNGSWMLNEMSDLYPDGKGDEIKMMQLPVISSIVEKCDSIKGENGGTADAELSSLIHAIDAGESALQGEGYNVSQEDYNTILDARKAVYVTGESATGVIPKAAKNKGLAKLFLQYMYSDEGIQIHASSNNGAVLPVVGYDDILDFDELNNFNASTYRIMLNSKKLFLNYKDAVLTPDCTATGYSIEKQFGSQNSNDRTRASKSYQDKKDLWSANNAAKYWDALRNKGLID